MSDLQQLIRQAQVQGRIPSPERALRWLRATASTLADWGGREARTTLREALPPKLLRGTGSSGRKSFERALAEDGSADLALASEVSERTGECDPGKVSWSLRACLSLVREQLSPAQLEVLAKALPPALAQRLGEARWTPPWRYRLVPQPFGEGRRRQPAAGHGPGSPA